MIIKRDLFDERGFSIDIKVYDFEVYICFCMNQELDYIGSIR